MAKKATIKMTGIRKMSKKNLKRVRALFWKGIAWADNYERNEDAPSVRRYLIDK